MKKLFPDHTYNWTTLIGTGIAAFGAAAIVILYLISIVQGDSNPYLGIFMLVLFPSIMIFGLILIPIGMVRARRRRGEPPVVDLRIPQHRNTILLSMIGLSIFGLASTVGLFKTYEYSESNQFCGTVCHVPMTPEYEAFQTSPHANIHCADCHVGPGGDYFVKAKLNGVRQLYHLAKGDFARPIPTPVHFLRPASEICEQCHWPEKLYTSREKTFAHYLGDRQNTYWRIRMLLPVDTIQNGDRRGIHWHNDPKNAIEYVSSDDSRGSFDQVTLKDGDRTIVYTATGQPLDDASVEAARLEHRVRQFDCLDCHNRPSHQYDSPMLAINEALAHGELDPRTPWIKRNAMQVLTPAYTSTTAAHDSIALLLRGDYPGMQPDSLEEIVGAVQGIHDGILFPEMRVRWEVYPDHNGHMISAGCFRCHGSDLQTATGKRISNDCALCHTIVAQGPPGDPEAGLEWIEADDNDILGLNFRHPLGIDQSEKTLKCWECHRGGAEVYLPRRLTP